MTTLVYCQQERIVKLYVKQRCLMLTELNVFYLSEVVFGERLGFINLLVAASFAENACIKWTKRNLP